MSPSEASNTWSLWPARLRERLEALDLTVVEFPAEGEAHLVRAADPLDEALAGSALLKAFVQRHRQALAEAPGRPRQVVDGLWLVPLPSSAEGEADNIPAVLMRGRELAQTETLHRICDGAGLDYQTTHRQLSRQPELTRTQAEQTGRLIGWVAEDASWLHRQRDELAGLSHELGSTYEELNFLYHFSSGISVKGSSQAFLEQACEELQEVMGVRWAALQLSEDAELLGDLAGRTFVSSSAGAEAESFRPLGRQLFQTMAGQRKALVVDDAGRLHIPGVTDWASSLLAAPVLVEERLWGLVIIADKLNGLELFTSEVKLCTSLADSLSVFLHNKRLYAEMQGMFFGTLHALTSAIDAKDSYTHGHSERVATLSRQLAEVAGFDENLCERVYLAGLVHDVGKIGVPEAVLCKPGSLSDEEFAQIKRHPRIGARILGDIPQMRDLIPGVLHHHERWDGRGYPDGLKGQDIPLYGRLIGLADAFDAMSSNRTYRRALAHESIIEEFHRCRGTQFDPELAELFVTLDFQPYHDMLAARARHAEAG